MANLKLGIGSAFVLVAMAAGCSDGTIPPPSFDERIDASSAMADRIYALPPTSVASMPVSGSAAYFGYAAVGLDTGRDGTYLLGDADIRMNFANELIRGTLNNFEGGNDSTLHAYSGALYVVGTIGSQGGNSFDGWVNGRLDGGGQQIDLAGGIDGGFYGSGAPAIGASTDDSLDAIVAGRTVDGFVAIIAEH